MKIFDTPLPLPLLTSPCLLAFLLPAPMTPCSSLRVYSPFSKLVLATRSLIAIIISNDLELKYSRCWALWNLHILHWDSIFKCWISIRTMLTRLDKCVRVPMCSALNITGLLCQAECTKEARSHRQKLSRRWLQAGLTYWPLIHYLVLWQRFTGVYRLPKPSNRRSSLRLTWCCREAPQVANRAKAPPVTGSPDRRLPTAGQLGPGSSRALTGGFPKELLLLDNSSGFHRTSRDNSGKYVCLLPPPQASGKAKVSSTPYRHMAQHPDPDPPPLWCPHQELSSGFWGLAMAKDFKQSGCPWQGQPPNRLATFFCLKSAFSTSAWCFTLFPILVSKRETHVEAWTFYTQQCVNMQQKLPRDKTAWTTQMCVTLHTLCNITHCVIITYCV